RRPKRGVAKKYATGSRAERLLAAPALPGRVAWTVRSPTLVLLPSFARLSYRALPSYRSFILSYDRKVREASLAQPIRKKEAAGVLVDTREKDMHVSMCKRSALAAAHSQWLHVRRCWQIAATGFPKGQAKGHCAVRLHQWQAALREACFREERRVQANVS